MIRALKLSETEIFTSCANIIFLRNGKISNCSAYSVNERAELLLKLPVRYGTTEINIEIFDESCTEILAVYQASWVKRDSDFDHYKAKLDIKKLGVGLYFLRISLKNLLGQFYAIKKTDKVIFNKSDNNSFIQFSVSDFKYRAPEKLLGGTIYHIFVDRFARGEDCKLGKGSILVENWSDELPEYPEYPGARVKNNYFYGGNLYGIINKLDYLKKLGVSAIYLSPIFESPSNHKYDTADYLNVDEGFGGDNALISLINEAKASGIGIILDGVFNHTGADSVYFNKFSKYPNIGAYQSRESEYFSWYDFKEYPDKYTAWWGIEILPRINPDLHECGSFFTKSSGVIDKYAKMGIEGIRLDVVDELSDEFVSEIKSRLNESNPTSVLYGEVWEDASNKIAYGKRKKYYLGNELDGVMNYPLRDALISYFRYRKTEKLSLYLFDILPNMPKRIRDAQMNLLGSHDTERILTALGGAPSEGKTNSVLLTLRMSEQERTCAKERLKMAYTTLATLPGIPTVYYGDEVGMEGYSDPFSRRTFPWGSEDTDILSHYKKIARIRKNPIYKSGELHILYLSQSLFLFERKDKKSTYLTAVNNGDCDVKLCFSSKVHSLLYSKTSKELTLHAKTADIIDAQGSGKLQIIF